MDEPKKKLTNMEFFLIFTGVSCFILSIGFLNWILGAAAVLCAIFAYGSIKKRTSEQ